MTAFSKMPFVRFHAFKKGDVTKLLNQIVPGKWVYSHYALTVAETVATGLYAYGKYNAPKPIMALLKDEEAGTLLTMFLEQGWQGEGEITIKQIDLVADTPDLTNRALYRYGGALTDYPWNGDAR